MDSAAFFAEHLGAAPVMGIFRGLGTPRTLELAEAAWSVGVRLIEVPVQDQEALDALRALVASPARHGRPVGAGTVTTPELARAAAEAGAEFTVAPGLRRRVAEESARLGMPHLPGVGTATEVGKALRWGLTWQKMFPAAQLGPDWAGALHGPFPEVRFVATGGVSASNAAAFLGAGVSAVALGSAFADPEQIAAIAPLIGD